MMRRSIVKAHRSIQFFVNTDTEEWDIEVAEPETPAVFRFPDDSEED